VGQQAGGERAVDAGRGQGQAAGVAHDQQRVRVATIAACGGQHLRGEVEPEDAAVRADRGPKVGKDPAGAAAHVHGGRVGGVVGGLWQAGT
jgi:general stress protein YciG